MVRLFLYVAALLPLTLLAAAVARCEDPKPSPATKQCDSGPWSKPTNGLQARVTLVDKSRANGTRMIFPYLELRNASDVANPMKVRCGDDHVKFELVDGDGKIVRGGDEMPRGGIRPEPGTISLPWDSSIRINMYCSNWGVPKDAAAMISTDSGAWVLKPEERGKVFLRATIKGPQAEVDLDRNWQGSIETPAVKVDWADEAPSPRRP